MTRTPDPGDPHRDPRAIDDARDQATRQLADTVPADGKDPQVGRRGGYCSRTSTPWPATHHRPLRALADFVRVLGGDHPQTLASRNNLAYAYQAAGDLGRAIPLHKQALADRQRVLGEDHPQTLASRNNLARAYQVFPVTLVGHVRVMLGGHDG